MGKRTLKLEGKHVLCVIGQKLDWGFVCYKNGVNVKRSTRGAVLMDGNSLWQEVDSHHPRNNVIIRL